VTVTRLSANSVAFSQRWPYFTLPCTVAGQYSICEYFKAGASVLSCGPVDNRVLHGCTIAASWADRKAAPFTILFRFVTEPVIGEDSGMIEDRKRPERRVRLPAILLAVLLLVLVGIGTVSALAWSVDTVESAGDVPYAQSLALDSNSYPAISYIDWSNHNLMYAWYDTAGWHTVTVDGTGNVGGDTSLALDSNGDPRISYYDWTNRDQRYAWYDGTWHLETVDSDGDIGGSSSLALDSTGKPRIAYGGDSTNSRLKYAAYDGMTWDIETVPLSWGNSATDISLVLDSAGNPRIAYYQDEGEEVHYASYDGSVWKIIRAAYGVDPYGTSLALDGAGNPRISYIATSFDPTPRTLMYAAFDGITWDREKADAVRDVWGPTSLALDGAGNPWISYFDYATGDLMVANYDSAAWQTEKVAPAGTATGQVVPGRAADLALAGDGTPRISFLDLTTFDLKYVTGISDDTGPTPAEAIADLRARVMACGVKDDVRKGLTDKLDSVTAALTQGNEKKAVNNMNAFTRLAMAQKGKALTATDADALIAEAQKIIAAIRL